MSPVIGFKVVLGSSILSDLVNIILRSLVQVDPAIVSRLRGGNGARAFIGEVLDDFAVGENASGEWS